MEACTLRLSNKTKRAVIHLQARYALDKDFESATQGPRAALHGWLKENDLHSDLRFVTQLFLKKIEDNAWMEAVATIRDGAVEKFLKASGRKGWFVKPWLNRAEPEDRGTQVIWVADDVSLKSALSQANRYGDKVLGLACTNVDLVFELLPMPSQAC